MYLFLLRKAIPFTLTFVVGAALSGLVGLFRPGATKTEVAAVSYTREGDPGRRGSCRMGRYKLVAETKPLDIRHVPEARWPLGAERGVGGVPSPARVRVTFGADGRVREVAPLTSGFRLSGESLVETKANWEAVERAARLIEFTPETVDGVPVTVARDVEIHFARGD